jgi:proline racemase
MRWNKVLNVVECHAGGEVGKVVTGGIGDVPGETMFDKKLYLEQHLDDIRKLLLFEPRGGVVHSANYVLPSRHPEALLGYVIAESTEYPAMSGSNTICPPRDRHTADDRAHHRIGAGGTGRPDPAAL